MLAREQIASTCQVQPWPKTVQKVYSSTVYSNNQVCEWDMLGSATIEQTIEHIQYSTHLESH